MGGCSAGQADFPVPETLAAHGGQGVGWAGRRKRGSQVPMGLSGHWGEDRDPGYLYSCLSSSTIWCVSADLCYYVPLGLNTPHPTQNINPCCALPQQCISRTPPQGLSSAWHWGRGTEGKAPAPLEPARDCGSVENQRKTALSPQPCLAFPR